MELTLHVEHQSSSEVGNNAYGALDTISENAGHIKQVWSSSRLRVPVKPKPHQVCIRES